MKPRIVAVGMLDSETFGSDTFFVQTSETEVMLYEAHKSGKVVATIAAPAPLTYVAASLEKFNNGYLLDAFVEIDSIALLPKYVGAFELAPSGRATLKSVAQP